MEHNWSSGGSSSEAGSISSSTHNPSSSTPYTDVGDSSSSPYTSYPLYSYSPPTSGFAPSHSTFGFAPYYSSSSYTIDYSGFEPYAHGAYSSDSGTSLYSISFPPQYSLYSQLLMSTSPIYSQSLAPFLTETQEQYNTLPALQTL